MGWGSAVYLFDAAVDVALDFIPKVNDAHTEIMTLAVVENMYKRVEWDDWDTQGDSKYFDKYLIHVMRELDEIDEDEYQYHVQGKPDDFDWDRW